MVSMKTQCLLRRNEYHTTALIDSKVTKLGLLVKIPELTGLWEIVEIYPYRLSDKELKDAQRLHPDADSTNARQAG